MRTQTIYNLCTIWTLVTMERKILGTSNLSGTHSLKATIIRDVVVKLNLKTGDKIVYTEEDGRIFIEKAWWEIKIGHRWLDTVGYRSDSTCHAVFLTINFLSWIYCTQINVYRKSDHIIQINWRVYIVKDIHRNLKKPFKSYWMMSILHRSEKRILNTIFQIIQQWAML